MLRSSRLAPLLLIVLAFQLSVVLAVSKLRIASPLQAFTIWDAEAKEEATTPRKRFLPRFRAGLEAESKARKEVAESQHQQLQVQATSKDWAKQASSADSRMRRSDDKFVELAYDEAVGKVEVKQEKQKKQEQKERTKNPNQFQFVGVINSAASETPITWYARKKPANANWSVRLVHANRDAIIKDLFNRGKVDVFAKYENTGTTDEETKLPVITSKYSVRERSWKNLWNFSPKHFFTDSSGMYWRERRLRPGIYTDGNMVYEASYRYRDGRNGMHRLSTFNKYLNSKAVDPSQKQKILQRLTKDAPDIVLEE